MAAEYRHRGWYAMDVNDSRTLFCGNLSHDVTEVMLYELFLQAGPVEHISLPRLKNKLKKTKKWTRKNSKEQNKSEDDCDVIWDIKDLMENNIQYGVYNDDIDDGHSVKIPESIVEPLEEEVDKFLNVNGVKYLVTDEYSSNVDDESEENAAKNAIESEFCTNLKVRAASDVVYAIDNGTGNNSMEYYKDGKHQNFAFVLFKHESSVQYAKTLFDGTEIFGQKMILCNRIKNKKKFRKSNIRTELDAPSDNTMRKNISKLLDRTDLDVLYKWELNENVPKVRSEVHFVNSRIPAMNANRISRRHTSRQSAMPNHAMRIPHGSISWIHNTRCWYQHSPNKWDPHRPRYRTQPEGFADYQQYNDYYHHTQFNPPLNQYQRSYNEYWSPEYNIPPYPFGKNNTDYDSAHNSLSQCSKNTMNWVNKSVPLCDYSQQANTGTTASQCNTEKFSGYDSYPSETSFSQSCDDFNHFDSSSQYTGPFNSPHHLDGGNSPLVYNGEYFDGSSMYGYPYGYTNEQYELFSTDTSEINVQEATGEEYQQQSRYAGNRYIGLNVNAKLRGSQPNPSQMANEAETSREHSQNERCGEKRNTPRGKGRNDLKCNHAEKVDYEPDTESNAGPNVADELPEFSNWQPNPEQEKRIKEDIEYRNQSRSKERNGSRLNMEHFLPRYSRGESDNMPRLKPSECHVKLSESFDLALDQFNKAKKCAAAVDLDCPQEVVARKKKNRKNRKS